MAVSLYKQNIKDYIGRELLKHPKINYLRTAWKYRHDSDFVDYVMHMYRDPNLLRMKSFGEKNLDKNIHLIALGGEMGLGGYLRRTFYGLADAERLGFTPVVQYLTESCVYAEHEPINGVSNPFEYYFEQVAEVSVRETYQSKSVFLFESAHDLRVEHDLGNTKADRAGGYDVNEAYLHNLARLMKRYIRLNKSTENFVLDGVSVLGGLEGRSSKILGVHIRGTDYSLNWKNHPNMVSVDEFITTIDNVLQQYGFDYIFLATDDATRLKTLRERYGNKLLYYKDVHRSSGKVSVAEEKNNRPLNHYLNGLEVIRDMYTLASCNGLICGLSQVSFIARIIRLSQGTPYEFLKVLDKGIYKG